MISTSAKVIITTAAFFAVALCVGYFFHRKCNKKQKAVPFSPTDTDILNINCVLNWIDSRTEIIKEEGSSYEVSVLPNSSTKELYKSLDSNVYAVILVKIQGEKHKVIAQDVFRSEVIDESLHSLVEDKVVKIPISL